MATILVVDDRPVNRDLLVTLLGHFGHRVIDTGDGAEALKLARVEHPALVITDIQMPSMDGFEFVQKLRADPGLARTPVIFFTATYRVANAQALGVSAGVSTVLAKPSEPEAILNAVNAALNLPASILSSPGPEERAGEHVSTAVTRPPSVISPFILFSHRLAALVEGLLDLASERDLEALLGNLCQMARELAGATYAMVGVLEGDEQTFAHFLFRGSGPETTAWVKAESSKVILGKLFEGRRPIRLRDVNADRLGIDTLPGHPPISSFLGVPIVSSTHIYGWLCLMEKLNAEEFSEEDERLATTLAAQGAVVYENITLYIEVKRRAADLECEVENRIRVEKELEQTRQEQLQLKDQFFSHVSHELRSPVAAAYQFTTILLDGLAGDLNPVQREHLGIVLRNVFQLRKMIDDLLEVTGAETGKLTVEPCCTSLADPVTEMVESFRVSAATAGVALSADVPSQLPQVYADSTRVRQILTNLVENAIKFTPMKGTITLRAQVFDEDPSFVRVSMADTGRGMSPLDAQLVFERLYQIADPEQAGRRGLGLGLYICKELVARHGGRIWAESQPGYGSTFSFTLPIFSLARLITPILAQPAAAVVLVTVDVRAGRQWPSAKARDTALRDMRKVVERCLLPDLDVLLPRIYPTDSGEIFFVLARTDASGADVLVQRIREQLKRCECLAGVLPPPGVSFTVIDLPAFRDEHPLERRVEYVAACLEELVKTTIATRS